MGFCANNAGNPNTILETQKAGYVSKHKSDSRIQRGICCSHELFAICYVQVKFLCNLERTVARMI